MKLEVGMYVRTNRGTIAKIIKEIKDGRSKAFVLDRIVIINNTCTEIIRRTDKVTSRHNIIDLLKRGDYVNGYMITDFGDDYYDEELDEDVEGFSIVLGNEEQLFRIPPKDIKTVLTKERFEEMQYKVVK